MLTYKDAQDLVLERFNEDRRPACKEWLNYVLGQIWNLEEWTFKQAITPVTVTAGSSSVTGLPGNVGVVHLLQNAQGMPLDYKDWREFQIHHYGDTGQQVPYDFTVVGSGSPLVQVLVGPISSETSALYQLLHEYERGFYPSTTVASDVTLPSATIQVTSTAGMAAAGTVLIGGRPVAYTGVTPGSLTGCTGGVGSFVAGDLVVFLAAQAGELANDGDVPMLPPETHQILVHAAQAIGQSAENDYSIYLSDDRVQQGLDTMRRRYLISQRGGTQQWGSYESAHFETGWAW